MPSAWIETLLTSKLSLTECCARDWAVICATTQAAGVGFNMHAANRVGFTEIGLLS